MDVVVCTGVDEVVVGAGVVVAGVVVEVDVIAGVDEEVVATGSVVGGRFFRHIP